MLTFNRNKYCSFKIGTNHEQKGVEPRDFEKKILGTSPGLEKILARCSLGLRLIYTELFFLTVFYHVA